MPQIWAELPQDLFWPIVDRLDATGLYQATLVCRAWMPYASERLLRRVVANHTTQYYDSPVTSCRHRTKRHDYAIFRDLVTRSERLRRYVRELHVLASWKGSPSTVLCMCRYLPRLEVLHLEGGLPALCIEEPTAFGGTLKLSGQDIGELVGILSVFTSIRHLYVIDTPRNEHPGVAVSKAQRSGSRICSIEEVTLREAESDTMAVLQVFVEPTTLWKVSLLGKRSWDWESESFFASFNVFLETTCKDITHLSLNTGYLDRDGNVFTALRSLSCLETLELKIPQNLPSVPKQFDKALAHVPETLSRLHLSLSPMALEALILPCSCNIVHISQLADTLQSVRFALLVRSPVSDSEMDGWRESLERVLPAHLQCRYTAIVDQNASRIN